MTDTFADAVSIESGAINVSNVPLSKPSRGGFLRFHPATNGQSRMAASEMLHSHLKAVWDRSLGGAGDRRAQPLPLKIDAPSAVDAP